VQCLAKLDKRNEMKNLGTVFLVMVLLILPSSVCSEEEQEIAGRIDEIKDTVYEDYRNFYSGENLGKLAIGLGVAGVLANTSADREIQNWYQESVRNKDTDNFSRVVKTFGEGMITIPLYLGAVLLGELAKDIKLGSMTGEWGERSLRTLLVGAPPMLFLQIALGASRPEEDDSHWRPFKDNNAVSGHGFMGAVPFIIAAKMTDNPYLRYCLYLVSTLCGLSRINDNAHYFSQAALGWWMAYLAATSVDRKREVTIAPAFIHNGIGVTVAFRF